MRFLLTILFTGLLLLSAYGQTPEVEAAQVEVAAASTVDVPIVVRQFQDVVSIQFTLQWDPSIVEYLSTEAYGLPGLSEFNFGEPEVDQGRLTFVWFDGQVSGITLADESTIFAVRFRAIGEAGEVSPLEFIDTPTPIQIGVINGVEIEEVEGLFTNGAISIIAETEPLTVTATVANNNCAGESMGSITPLIEGGAPPYTYSWSGPGGFMSMAEQLDGLVGGDYELTVTSADGQTETSVFTVSSPPELMISSLTTVESDCNTPTGSIEVIVMGGTPDYKYNFGSGFSTDNNSGPLAGGTYTLIVQDALGCQLDTLITVTEADAPTVTLGDDIFLCPDEVANLSAEGTGDGTYTWFRDGELLTETEAAFSTTVPGIYEVELTNAAGCTASDELSIAVAPLPPLNLGPDTSICPKTTLFLVADGSYASYEWLVDGEMTGNDTPELAVSEMGIYTLTAISDAGCTLRDTVQIDLVPFLSTVGPDTTIIAGDTLQLQATGGISYQWSGSETLSCTDCATPEVVLEMTTTFLITITSAEGCEATETLTINVEEAPELDVNIVNFLSPNGDGKNDVLFFRGLDDYPINQLSIFNRWGDLLFSKPNYQRDGVLWDATFNGQLVPAGVYYYVLQVGTTAQPIKSSLTIVHN